MILGSHVSFKKDTQLKGSVIDALSYGCSCFMFYTGAPQNTVRSDISESITNEALKLMSDNNIDINNVVVHAPYIINMASDNPFAVEFLQQEIKRLKQLRMTKLVLHPGSSVKLSEEEGINNIINNLNKIDNMGVTICLETMAGKGSELGRNFEQIKKIIDGVNYKLGVCLDTCHVNDAGYDVSNFDFVLDEFDRVIGLDYLKCVHINDSKNEFNAHKDRHENIGFGYIGFDNMINIIYNEKLKDVPKILETPFVKDENDSYPPYKFEIEMIKNKKFNPNLYDDIKNYYNGF